MSWNYRVIHRRFELGADLGHEDTYAIHEVYYDDHGVMTGVTEHPAPVVGSSLHEMHATRLMMARGAAMPVIEWEDVVRPKAAGAEGDAPEGAPERARVRGGR